MKNYDTSYAAIKAFLSSERGAVTVDWVVLTAASCLLGLFVMVIVYESYGTPSNNISDAVSAVDDQVDGLVVRE